MKITECISIADMTVLFLPEDMPKSGWRKVRVDGILFDPIPVMDVREPTIAIKGNYDFTGKEISFE